MARKRKKSKDSPDNGQTNIKQTTKKYNKGNKMAQSAQCTTGYNQNDQLQASQFFNCSQIHSVPLGQCVMGTPSFHGQNFMTPNTPISPISPNQAILSSILDRLNSMDNKLTQLDKIQSCVSAITSRVDTLDKRINDIEVKIKDVEKSCDFSGGAIGDITKQQQQFDSILKKFNEMKTSEESHISKELRLQAEITDLKCRRMRDYLLFFRIPKEKGENCENTILEFIENNLKLQNAKEEIKIHRAHRIGTYRPEKVMPIVAKFAFYPDKERVQKASKNLNGTSYGVAEQYPPEVMEKRRKLVPIMKAARGEGKEAFIRVDKLYINKKAL